MTAPRLAKRANAGRAVGYVRVSTQKQGDSGLGLEAQEEAVREAATRLGLSLEAIYPDAGVHGNLPPDKRAGLSVALRSLRSGDTLLVAKRDRLSRDSFLAAVIEREMQRKGVRIVSAAGEGTDDDGPSSILMRRMLDAFAEYERLVIGIRTAGALEAKKARGEKTGRFLEFGYRECGERMEMRPGRAPKRIVRIEPDEAEQAWIREMRAWSAAGKSDRWIARKLDGANVPTRRGGKWNHRTVMDILARDPLDVSPPGYNDGGVIPQEEIPIADPLALPIDPTKRGVSTMLTSNVELEALAESGQLEEDFLTERARALPSGATGGSFRDAAKPAPVDR